MSKSYVTQNCANRESVNFAEYQIKAKSPQYDVVYDDRHLLFSENNTFDIAQYLNYIDTIKEIAQKEPNTGKYRYMLDLGFIPVSMPPIWLVDTIYPKVRMALEREGIEYFQLPASSFIQGTYTGGTPDIWVSKLSVNKMCNCKPELVTVRKVLEVLHIC